MKIRRKPWSVQFLARTEPRSCYASLPISEALARHPEILVGDAAAAFNGLEPPAQWRTAPGEIRLATPAGFRAWDYHLAVAGLRPELCFARVDSLGDEDAVLGALRAVLEQFLQRPVQGSGDYTGATA